jgi:phage tail-like protein
LRRKIIAISSTFALIAVIFGLVFTVYAPPPDQPLPAYNFLVEIDGIVEASFTEVEGLNVTVDVVEYREGSDSSIMLIPGVARYGPLILKNGLTESDELLEWMETTVDGTLTKRSLSVIILYPNGEEATRYNCYEAWPSSWRLSKLDSLHGGETAFEEIVIQYELLEKAS